MWGHAAGGGLGGSCRVFPALVSSPAKDLLVFINGQPFGINQVSFQVFYVLPIKAEATLQDLVHHTFVLLRKR